MKLKLPISISFCIFLLACNSVEKNAAYSSYLTDSLSLASGDNDFRISDGREFMTQIYCDSSAATNYFYLFSQKKNKICKVDLGTGRLIDRYTIPGLSQFEIYNFETADGKYFYFSAGGLLIKTDTGKIVKTYYIENATDERFYSYAYGDEVHLNMHPDSTFYQMLRSKGLDQDSPGWIKERALLPCVGKFKLVGDSIRCIDSVAYFPEDYKRVYHYDDNPHCVFANNNIVYLFGTGDSIFSYNLSCKNQRQSTSISALYPNYKPLLFNKDSMNNINYLYEFAVTSSSIRLFLYDPYRKVYYLGIKKAQSYLSEDGTRVNDVFDFPFTILVLDTNFKKIKTVDFPDGRFTALYQSFVTPKGLYLMLAKRKKITYEIYDFSRATVH